MGNSPALHEGLKQIVGEDGLLTAQHAADYRFDGYAPKTVVTPSALSMLQDALRFAAQHRLSVLPAGAGTKLGIGNLTEKVDILLSTRHLNRIIEYEPADLTVTVEAGIRLADLQAELAQRGQYLPLQPPYADRCTLGGIVSTNASGPLRLRHGTPRNQVLGLHVVRADGTRVKSGGKVVKNVAGYDLNKLYIGAFGTLGIITEITLKLVPTPTHEVILTADFQTLETAAEAGLQVLGSQTLPTFVSLSITPDTDRQTPNIAVGFAGDPDTVTWQSERCQQILEQNGASGVLCSEGEQRAKLHETIQTFPAASHTDTQRVVAKLNLRRTDVADLAAQVLEADWAHAPTVQALLGGGVLYIAVPVDADTDFEALAKIFASLRNAATETHGNLIIETAPPELKRQIDVWGDVGKTSGLMRQIKTEFDPNGLLNPGRFVSGI